MTNENLGNKPDPILEQLKEENKIVRKTQPTNNWRVLYSWRNVSTNNFSINDNKPRDMIVSFSCNHKMLNGKFEFIRDTIIIKEPKYNNAKEKLDLIKKEIAKVKFNDLNPANLTDFLLLFLD